MGQRYKLQRMIRERYPNVVQLSAAEVAGLVRYVNERCIDFGVFSCSEVDEILAPVLERWRAK